MAAYTVYMNSITSDKSNTAVGFASLIDDHLSGGLDLNKYLIKHPMATFFMRATGNSMSDAGILNGDLLIVDKSLTPQNNSIIIAILNGEFAVKRLKIVGDKGLLISTNSKHKPIVTNDIEGFQFWGVVTHAIHNVCLS